MRPAALLRSFRTARRAVPTESKQRHLRLHLRERLRGLFLVAGFAVAGERRGFGDGGIAVGVSAPLVPKLRASERTNAGEAVLRGRGEEEGVLVSSM